TAGFAGSAARFSCSPTTCAPRCGSRRSCGSPSSTSARPTPSASAGMVPPPTPRSTPPCCRPPPTSSCCAPPPPTPTSRPPAVRVPTRQTLPVLARSALGPANGAARGAYVLLDPPGGHPQAILIATGSEVHVALATAKLLQSERVRVRVVSMPSWELFAAQPEA